MARAVREFTPIYGMQVGMWIRDARKIKSLKISDAGLRRAFRPMIPEFKELFTEYITLAAFRGWANAQKELRFTPQAAINWRKRFELDVGIKKVDEYINNLGNSVANMAKRPIYTKADSRKLSDLGKSLAFYVDKLEEENLVAKAKEVVKSFLRDNRTVEDFQKEFPKKIILKEGGFTLAHMETILRTNIMQSFNVSRTIAFREAGVPAAQYIAIVDDKLTEICRPFHLAVVRFDSRLYAQISPLQHHRCRCIWSPVTQRMLDTGKYKFKPRAEIQDAIGNIKEGFKQVPQKKADFTMMARNWLAEKREKLKKIK